MTSMMMPVYVLRVKSYKIKQRNGGVMTPSSLSFKERAADKLLDLRVANAVDIEYYEVPNQSWFERIVAKLLSF